MSHSETSDDDPPWETAELVAARDPSIAGRLLATHPPSGSCPRCQATAPCSMRLLGLAAERAGRASWAPPRR